jgi:lipopolysaccharide biosynthesis glycosyltransferase
MNGIHLACASDQRYVPHSAAMLRSALANRGARDLHVHYLCGPRFPDGSASLLTAMVERNGGSITIHRIPDDWVSGMPAWQYIGSSMWYRIFLPELLPDIERVLYLDVDTIVVDSLEPLWTTELEDCYLAAVSNVFELHQLHRPERLGLLGPHRYFNSGVLLMNLDSMRADGCTVELARHARERSAELLWPDQDTLNVVLGSRRLALHPRWNCMNAVLGFPWSEEVFGAEALEEARRRPGIRHFEGPGENKPWHYLCDWDARDLYLEYRRGTPWPEVKVEGRTPGNLVRRWWRRRGESLRSGRAALEAVRP